jgi:hypothetical protein
MKRYLVAIGIELAKVGAGKTFFCEVEAVLFFVFITLH